MKEVRLNVNGKVYAKTQPMVKDWKAMMEFTEAVNGKNYAKDPETLPALIEHVADFLNAPADQLEEHCPVDALFEAMRIIDANMGEAFRGATDEKNAAGGQAPPK